MFPLLQVFRIPFTHVSTFFYETPTMQHASCSSHLNRAVVVVVSFLGHENGGTSVASRYRVRRTPAEESVYMPRFPYRRRMLRHEGGLSRYFLMYLFSEQSTVNEFLKDVGQLRSKMQCNTCGRDMAWSADSNHPKGFCWRCQRFAGVRCNQSASIKQGLWFQQSNLTPLSGTAPFNTDHL